MVSGNGGTWSSSDKFWNNVVAGFKFKEGDSITCVVNGSQIDFIKDVPA
jgi:hypothetical protein